MTEQEFKKEKTLLKSKISNIQNIISCKKGGPKTPNKLANAKKAYDKLCAQYGMRKQQAKQVEQTKTFIGSLEDSFGFDKIFFTEVEIKVRYDNKKKNAKERDLEFNLTLETFTILLQQTHCYYTGIKYQSMGEISIDRVDNEKGYVEGNCVSCHGRINGGKSDFSLTEIKAVYERIVKFKQPKIKVELNAHEVELVYKSMESFLSKKSLEEFNPCT